LQSLQYPLSSSLTSKSTLNEEGTDALHVSGGLKRILVESKVENMTVAGTDVVEYVTKTEEALMTAGNPANSTSTAAIAPDVDRHGTFVAPDILEATTGTEWLAS